MKTRKRIIAISILLVNLIAPIHCQDARLRFGPWRLAHWNETNRYPTDVYDIYFNPIPLEKGHKVDSAFFYHGDYHHQSWNRAYKDSCAWNTNNILTVWRKDISSPYYDAHQLCQYKFDDESRFLEYVRLTPPFNNNEQYQEFRYNNYGELVYTYNHDRSDDLGHNPVIREYTYNSPGQLFSSLKFRFGQEGDSIGSDYTEFYYTYNGLLSKTKTYSNLTGQPLEFCSQTFYYRNNNDQLIHTQTQGITDEIDSLHIIDEWFAYYSDKGEKDSTYEIYYSGGVYYPDGFWSKEFFTYDENGEIASITHQNQYSNGNIGSWTQKFSTEITDNEIIRITYSYKDSLWLPSSYYRQLFDGNGRILEKESWGYRDGKLDDNWHTDGKDVFEWNDNGLLNSYKRYIYYPEPGDLPTFQVELHWSKSSSSEIIEDPEEQLILYPNPADDWIRIDRLNDVNANILVEIYSSMGVLLKRHLTKSFYEKIDISNFTDGIYFVKLSSGGISTVKKLIIN